MVKVTLVIAEESISVSSTEADVVTLSITQGTSLWEADGADHIKPKGGKTVDAPYLELGGKVDKVSGYGLSQNDFTDDLETKLNDLPLASDLTSALNGKVDVVSGKELSDNNYTDGEVLLVASIPNKVDAVAGKELSDNNYTDGEVIKVGYITGTGAGDMFLSDDGDYKLTPMISGFTNKNTVGVSYDSTTRKITLSGSFKAYYAGEEVTALTDGWVSDAHADVAGVYYLYYDGSFHFGTGAWNLQTVPKPLPIAYVVYDGVKFGLRECHGFQDGESHFNAHRNLGTTKFSGGSVSNVVTGSTTAANRRPYISETVIADEDLFTTLSALTTNAYSIRYLTGANTRTFSVDQTDIVPLNGNIPYWNEFTGGSWTQTPMTNNYYAAVFVAAMPVSGDTASQKLRYLFVQPQTQSSSLATIQGLTPSSVSLGDSTMLSAEYVFTHKIIIQYVGPSTNNWVITSVSELAGTKIQQVAVSPSPTVASNVTFTPAGGIAAINVQAAIEEVDSEKQATLVSGTNIKSINGTSLLGSGDITIESGGGSASTTTFTPAGNIVATDVQNAIEELDSEKASTSVATTVANGLMSSTDKTRLDDASGVNGVVRCNGSGDFSQGVDSGKYYAATAGSNGDFYITLPTTLATNDIVFISFPAATNAASAARLSVDNGSTYKAIKVQGSAPKALDVQSRKIALYYDGTDFISMDKPMPSYAHLIGSSGSFQALTGTRATFTKYNTTSVIGAEFTANASAGTITCNFDGYVEIAAHMMFYGCTAGDAVITDLVVGGTTKTTQYVNAPVTTYFNHIIPPIVLAVTSGQTILLQVINATAARGNSGNNSASATFGCFLSVKRV